MLQLKDWHVNAKNYTGTLVTLVRFLTSCSLILQSYIIGKKKTAAQHRLVSCRPVDSATTRWTPSLFLGPHRFGGFGFPPKTFITPSTEGEPEGLSGPGVKGDPYCSRHVCCNDYQVCTTLLYRLSLCCALTSTNTYSHREKGEKGRQTTRCGKKGDEYHR